MAAMLQLCLRSVRPCVRMPCVRPLGIGSRALSSSPSGGRPRRPPLSEAARRELEAEAGIRSAMWEKLNSAGPEPRFRPPPPMPPTSHSETWAPASLVSDNPSENALTFVTRFYIDATGEQPDYANKVQLTVNVSKLGLNEQERSRLLAVTSRHYNRKRDELLFTCRRYTEVARNKAELRETVARLVADAREQAEAHASTAESELPLLSRSRPWAPRDPRAYRGHPPNRFKNTPG